MKIIENPVKTCDRVFALIQSLTRQIRKRLEDPKSAGAAVSPLFLITLKTQETSKSGLENVYTL